MTGLRPLLAACALTLPALAQAEQFYLGYSHWNYAVSGAYDEGATRYDLDKNLNARGDSHAQYRLRWDTGAGWWPDFAASYGRVALSGQQSITTSVVVGPVPVGTVSSVAQVDANVRDLDATLRYGLPLGWARLSGGVTVKKLRGNVVVTDSAATPSQTLHDIDEIFPMAHLFAEVPLGSRLRLGAGGNWIASHGDEADEMLVQARLKLIGPLDLTGGWQRKHYRVTTDSYRLRATLQGWQFGGELAF
ncbi:MAG: hypothetical protein E6R07_06785 [Nevskiaceae bacterium]|nr:MAG: hypothetical protein E6R07_06785 [Nevskiaceae bacterium]